MSEMGRAMMGSAAAAGVDRARLAAEQAVKAAQQLGIQEVDLFVKGPGPGRENAIRAVQSMGMKVRSMSDITPVPHNGCRPPKKRRV
jgi:small subunit ribosomal protein S11